MISWIADTLIDWLMNCCCSVAVTLVHYSVFTLPYSVTQSTDQGPHWDWACDSIKAQRKFLQRMRTKSHAGKGKGKEEGGVDKYRVKKFHSKDDWLLCLRLISYLYFYYTWCEVMYTDAKEEFCRDVMFKLFIWLPSPTHHRSELFWVCCEQQFRVMNITFPHGF